jgi:hypothetical protein
MRDILIHQHTKAWNGLPQEDKDVSTPFLEASGALAGSCMVDVATPER